MDQDLETPAAIVQAFAKWRPVSKAKSTPDQIKQFAIFVRSAVEALFDAAPVARPVALAQLVPLQQTLLQEIAKVPYELYLNAGDLGAMLESVGAINLGPGEDDRYLRRYVGLCEPSPLEVVVEGRPLWLWLRLHLMGEVTRDAWSLAAGLDAASRIEICRRALDNAYQLMRRYPLPADITAEIEREDAARLYQALMPLLESVSPSEIEEALASELDAEIPSPELVLLVSLALARRGETLAERFDDIVSEGLELQSNADMGRELLALIAHDRRLALVRPLELVPYNVSGWVYLDLLSPSAAGELLVNAIRDSSERCEPKVAALVRSLVKHVDTPAKHALGKLAAENGPNSALLLEALTG